jgi:hypothetical protein
MYFAAGQRVWSTSRVALFVSGYQLPADLGTCAVLVSGVSFQSLLCLRQNLLKGVERVDLLLTQSVTGLIVLTECEKCC